MCQERLLNGLVKCKKFYFFDITTTIEVIIQNIIANDCIAAIILPAMTPDPIILANQLPVMGPIADNPIKLKIYGTQNIMALIAEFKMSQNIFIYVIICIFK